MDEKLAKSLKSAEAPPPSQAARARALDAAMMAFDQAQVRSEEKSAGPVQGKSQGKRLRSIVSKWKRTWTMDIRLPLGASLAALLIVPLSWQLMSQTAFSPFDFGRPMSADGSIEPPQQAPQTQSAQETAASVPLQHQIGSVPPPSAEFSHDAVTALPAPAAEIHRQSITGPAMFAPGQTGDVFAGFAEGGIKFTAQDPVSTFSLDVDTASYAYVRRMLGLGQRPQADAVRVEELINYFSYDYPVPEAEGHPFAPSIHVYPSPWNSNNRLVHIGIKGEALVLEDAPPSNLVFLIDTSGSMDGPDRIELAKRSLGLVVEQMGPQDTISIVTYAGEAGIALEPTQGDRKAEIMAVVDGLVAAGSTAGSAGIQMAYELAERATIAGGINRVILATDGDFNVGISEPGALEEFIAGKRQTGIGLSVLGFGMGNYADATMQALAQAGNGNAAYIDSFAEARKVLVEELGGTLMTIASDVKVQVEFNPATVSEYRLIGYETRALNREDFNDDGVDAGEIGAGHSVTAIYEITPVGTPGSVDPLRYGEDDAVAPSEAGDEYGFLKIRYKAPGSDTSELIETPISVTDGVDDITLLPDDIRFAAAVAGFGQKLRGSGFVRGLGWDDIRELAVSGRGTDETGRRAEFIRLVEMAQSLD